MRKLNFPVDIVINLLGDSQGNQTRVNNPKNFLNYQTASTNLINFFAKKKLIDLYKLEVQRNTDRHLSQEKKARFVNQFQTMADPSYL